MARLFLGCLLLLAASVASAAVSVTSAATVCPSVTQEITSTNLITNSDFSNTATSSIGVGGGVGTATMNTLPANNAISFQSGGTTYTAPNPDVIQEAFPGDSARNIASSNYWLLANGNNGGTASNRTWWSQTVSGLVSGITYTFVTYVSSPVNGAQTSIPSLSLRVTQSSVQTIALGLVVADTAAADVWTIYQTTFLASQTTATLGLINTVATNTSEPRGLFALAQPTLRRCAPLVDLYVTKTNSLSAVTAGVTVSYEVTVVNNGPNAANGAVLTDTPSSGMSCTSVTCTGAEGGAACPVAGSNPGELSIGNLLPPGGGVTLSSLPANSTIDFSLTCGITATGS
ncbi:MAG: hypothetical protein Q7T63_12285 [Burkholderiaceae bacterium]|nr:hypothetical protein [Burkholderiaceae bacterium]